MRLFIGIELASPARRAVAEAIGSLEILSPGKYVREDMLHITLAFPGDTDEERLVTIKKTMLSAAKCLSPFEITLAAPGYFGKTENAILYIGTQPSEELASAAEILRSHLTEAEIAFDPKPFVSHITVARKARVTPEALSLPVENISFTAAHLTLFHSHRVDDILRYDPIFHAELTKK